MDKLWNTRTFQLTCISTCLLGFCIAGQSVMSATPMGGSLTGSGLMLLDSKGSTHQLHPSRPTTASQVPTTHFFVLQFGSALHHMLSCCDMDQAFHLVSVSCQCHLQHPLLCPNGNRHLRIIPHESTSTTLSCLQHCCNSVTHFWVFHFKQHALSHPNLDCEGNLCPTSHALVQDWLHLKHCPHSACHCNFLNLPCEKNSVLCITGFGGTKHFWQPG